MITPTEAEVAAIKADARRRFGSDRCALVRLTSPIDAAVVVAPFDLRYLTAHIDARSEKMATAQSAATVDRLLWCSAMSPAAPTVDALEATKDDPQPLRRVALERLEDLRETWPVIDIEIERELRKVAGCPVGMVLHAVQLTAGNAPQGLSAAKAQEMLDAAPRVGAGSLWSVRGENGVGLVLKAPLSDVYLAARAAWSEAQAKHAGILDSYLVLVRQLVAWSPEPFDAYIEGHPGYAEGLWSPLFEMGGAAATATTSFL